MSFGMMKQMGRGGMRTRGMKRLGLGLMVVLGPLAGGPVPAGSQVCTSQPRYGWVSVAEIEARLKTAGWRLIRMRITNEACYAALVMNTRGQVVELRIHPATSQVLLPDGTETGAQSP